jgi:REP element-mobilizing transposase RayT
MRGSKQRELVFRTHGGRLRGAGRKPKGERPLVSHVRRAHVSGREPILVTMKVLPRVWNLRTRRAFERLVPAMLAAKERLGMRLVHFSIEHDHVHLLVEAMSNDALFRAMCGLACRFAKRLNRLMGRATGEVFGDRFHARVLTTPRAVRTALAYVLCNFRKHGAARPSDVLDPFSSAQWFVGWRGVVAIEIASAPVAAPRTWLLGVGWQRAGGPIDPRHHPGVLPA